MFSYRHLTFKAVLLCITEKVDPSPKFSKKPCFTGQTDLPSRVGRSGLFFLNIFFLSDGKNDSPKSKKKKKKKKSHLFFFFFFFFF